MCRALLATKDVIMYVINPTLDDYLEWADPEAIRFDGLDDAVVGVDHRGFLLYDHSKMIEVLEEQGMTADEAYEWIDYNVIPVMAGEGFTVIYQ